jgi:hypothetical protein
VGQARGGSREKKSAGPAKRDRRLNSTRLAPRYEQLSEIIRTDVTFIVRAPPLPWPPVVV